jgi:mevalonate kinase
MSADVDPTTAHAAAGAVAVDAAARACGRGCSKAILLGEHAVVYGVPALAVGLQRGATAKRVALQPGTTVCTLHVPEWKLRVAEGEGELLAQAFARLLAITRDDDPAFRDDGAVAIEAAADVPPGGGLGCSAAVGVAVARALDPAAPAAVIERRVMAWEGVFHGNPSGIDAAASAHGGALRFERGRPIEFLRLRSSMHLAVGHSGVASSTKAMVDAVCNGVP